MEAFAQSVVFIRLPIIVNCVYLSRKWPLHSHSN